MMLTEEEFRLFRNLIYQESGIYFKETKKDFLENRVVKRMTETKTQSPYWYYKLVTERRSAELVKLLDVMTVNETSFFRNRPQLELFRAVILRDIITKKLSGPAKRIRIWSAGCSTGEEPYTIGMLVHQELLGRPGWDVKIYASDLSLKVLQIAQGAEYALDKVMATVDDEYVERYFRKNDGTVLVKDEIKNMVVFDYHNLKNDNGLRDLDVIFCRNVMIYFDLEEQKRLAAKFYESLNPGGYLVIGHAESFQGWNTGFRFIYQKGGTAYKKPAAEEL
jgi:chemotaxis protein methyltransferase CheR